MPYSRNRELPSEIKDAIPSKSGKDLFRSVVNASLRRDESEQAAFQAAWSALQQAGYGKNDKGFWVKKSEDSNDAQEPAMKSEAATIEGQILKSDEQRMVWGWATVSTENGELVVDTDGDTISPEEMEKAATAFMEDVRKAKAMHQGGKVGEVVHSLPLTNSLAKAFGLNTDKEGWIIGMKVHDDEVWEKVRDGEYAAFSIGGNGERE